MSVSFRLPAVLAAVLSLSACATLPASKQIDPDTKAKVTATQSVLLIQQNEIYADIVRGTPGAGGLIGALIQAGVDKSRTNKAEQAMVPVRNDLLDFDFDSMMTASLQAGISQVGWLHATPLKKDKDPAVADIKQMIIGADQPYTLIFFTDYHLTPDFHALLVSMKVGMYPKYNDTKSNSDQPISSGSPQSAVYTQTIVYRENIPDDTLDAIQLPPKPPVQNGPDGRPLPSNQPDLDDDQRQAIIYWTKDNAAPLKAALTDAIAVTARLATQDLAQPLSAPAGAKLVKVDSYGKGLVLEQSDSRYIVLLADGHGVISSNAADVDIIH